MNDQMIYNMIKSIYGGESFHNSKISESIDYVCEKNECILATKLAYCFGETDGDKYAWALERLLSLHSCPEATGQAIKFLCRKGFFEKFRDLTLEWAAVSPSRATDTAQKSLAIAMIGEHLKENKDKFLRDFIARKIEHYLNFDEDELSPYEVSEKHHFQQAAADAMGADMAEILLCDDIDHSERLEEYWVGKFLKERTEG